MTNKYKLKMPPIEAIQYLRDDNIHEVQYFFEKNRDNGKKLRYQEVLNEYAVYTANNDLRVLVRGDYILRDLSGNYYVMREDEFLKRYERMGD